MRCGHQLGCDRKRRRHGKAAAETGQQSPDDQLFGGLHQRYHRGLRFPALRAGRAAGFREIVFPALRSLVGTMEAFGIYAVGFVSRPVGAALFGHYCDRIGRKVTLIATLLLTGLSTFAVGFVPGYAVIGVWGALILTVVRFIQPVHDRLWRHAPAAANPQGAAEHRAPRQPSHLDRLLLKHARSDISRRSPRHA